MEKFEQEHNVQIPKDYKKFLLKYNKGCPEPNYYKCGEKFGINVFTKEKGEDVLRIGEFLGLEPWPDVIDLYDGFDITEEILEKIKNLHVFGRSLGSDYFLISLAGENKGKIYFWSNQDTLDQNLFLIADNFEQFFNGLQENPKISNFEKYCDKNDVESIKKLLDNGLNINSLAIPNSIFSLLIMAIMKRKPDVIKLLIERGADVKGSIWLIYPDQVILALLLARGADINERNASGETPLFRFVAMSEIETIKFLLKNGADVFAKDNKSNDILDVRINDLKYSNINPEDDEIVKIIKKAMQKKE